MMTFLKTRRPNLLGQALLGVVLAAGLAQPARAQLAMGNNPLYLVGAKANMLMILDNSNSMDEDASGAAVGSNAANSKSEIARSVIRTLTDTYQTRINMGLMAYRQTALLPYYLHNSPYDVSFDPLSYDPTWTGARSSATHKKFRIPNPTSTGNYIYYNVALPFYMDSAQGNTFCYSNTANASNDFDNGEDPINGPWDNYRCFTTKTGTSNLMPTWGNNASETANGWSGLMYSTWFYPTDSDLAQGITDFGRFFSWSYVGRTYFANTSPGRGYLHVPIADLTSAQAASIKAKLACNVPDAPSPCANTGIANGGLTPIEGTLLTARDYFAGTLTNAGEGYTSGCYPLPTSCGKNFAVLITDGLPSTDRDGTIISDPTLALAEAATAAAALRAQGVLLYVIGFALPYGTDGTTLNQLAAAGGTTTAYLANDATTLSAALDSILVDLLRRTSSFGSVSQNSTVIDAGTLVFQGRFSSADWTGEVLALRPTDSGSTTQVWSSADAANIPAPSLRKVFTYVPGTGGVEFKLLTSLSTTQQTALSNTPCSGTLTGATCAQARIDWLRGVRTQEAPAGPLRARSRLHGDVISSSPAYFKESNTVYVGANDGMLHAINASTGAELFTYLPNAVMDRVYKLTAPNYSHEYFVDGEIAISSAAQTGTTRILVASLGRGAKALEALDVTDPTGFTAAKVKWEFTDADLGNVLGKPIIVKLNSGDPAVIVGNGVNSTNNRAVLFIINLSTGALIRKIDTLVGGTGSATNGLSSPRGWDVNGDGMVDVVYAGDLQGNLWKFSLSGSTASGWVSAFTSGSNPAPMFVAVDALGNRQPITGIPGVGINGIATDPNFGKRYVWIGTGRYLVSADTTNMAEQSWYGMIDDGNTVARTDLKVRTFEVESTVAAGSARAVAPATAGDMSGKKGWVIDLKSPSLGDQGERMIGDQKFYGRVLTAVSILPSNDVCNPGGTGYTNAVDPFTGAALETPYFDGNNDALFTSADRIGTPARSISSLNTGTSMVGDGALVGGLSMHADINGVVQAKRVNRTIRSGRISWRESVTQ